MNPQVGYTILHGPKKDYSNGSGFCSLLEIDDAKLLLDCGASITLLDPKLFQITDDKIVSLNEEFNHFLNKVTSIFESVDAVLLSQGDIASIGALPLIARKLGKSFKIICTLPVFKMAQMVLYDTYLNFESSFENSKNPIFRLDDIDFCLSKTTIVKYNQLQEIKSKNGTMINICAFPNGRIVGGSLWSINRGVAKILYAIGINVKKEIVLDGADPHLFPTSPTMLILDGNCLSTTAAATGMQSSQGSTQLSNKKKKDTKSPQDSLISSVLDTLRSNTHGNILIPCESAGRVLEIIQLLVKNVMDNKSRLEIDSLIYLSPMSHNIIEFAKCQLEWMSNSLCDSFYKGKSNPFDFTPSGRSSKKEKELLKCATSLSDIDKMGPGVKIILATDISLSIGYARELLLRWGGDKNCKVIFTSEPESKSLGASILSQLNTPPIIITVEKEEEIALEGNELQEFLNEAEKERKKRLEEVLQRKREIELSMLLSTDTVGGGIGDEEDEDENEDEDEDENEEVGVRNESKMEIEVESDKIKIAQTNTDVVETSDSSNNNNNNNNNNNRKTTNTLGSSSKKSKPQPVLEGIAKFARPRYPQFENWAKTPNSSMINNMEGFLRVMEYGADISELNIPEFISPVNKKSSRFSSVTEESNLNGESNEKKHLNNNSNNNILQNKSNLLNNQKDINDIKFESNDGNKSLVQSKLPVKKVMKSSKIQLTCSFSFIPLDGRADVKALKRIISEINPQRVIVFQSSDNADVFSILKHARDNRHEAFSPEIGKKIQFTATGGMAKVFLPASIRTLPTKRIRESNCLLKSVKCFISEISLDHKLMDSENVYSHNFILAQKSDKNDEPTEQTAISLKNKTNDSSFMVEPLFLSSLSHSIQSKEILGRISFGEVSLNSLRSKISNRRGSNISVEYKLGIQGASVISNNQVVVRKINENDFLLEGSPGNTFYQTREILYSNFTSV